VKRPILVEDLHATILKQLGIDPSHETLTKIGRPMKYSEGDVIKELAT
jgi:hypothetical protein